MAMDLGSKGSLKADINVTPLVDVMLVLLIIMMLVAPLLEQGVAVKLPSAANYVDKPESQDQTVIANDAEKHFYLNAKSIKNDDLGNKVKDLLENKKEKIVVVKADEGVDYSAVMQAMDELRKAGIEDVGLATEKKNRPGQSAGGQ